MSSVLEACAAQSQQSLSMVLLATVTIRPETTERGEKWKCESRCRISLRGIIAEGADLSSSCGGLLSRFYFQRLVGGAVPMKQETQTPVAEWTLRCLFRMAATNLTGPGPTWTWVKLLTERQYLNLVINLLERAEALMLVPEEIHQLMRLLATKADVMTPREIQDWMPEILLWKNWPLATREPIVAGTSPQESTGAAEVTGASITSRAVLLDNRSQTVWQPTDSESSATVEPSPTKPGR